MWQFLSRMAHVTSAYEKRQTNWALYVERRLLPVEAGVRTPPPAAAARPPSPVRPSPPGAARPPAATTRPQTLPVIPASPTLATRPQTPPVRPTVATRPASVRNYPYLGNIMYLKITF